MFAVLKCLLSLSLHSTADMLPLPNLVFNPYTWANISNMIFCMLSRTQKYIFRLPTSSIISLRLESFSAVEAPAGVGFSYSNTPAVDYVTDDNKTALDNYHFLVKWFGNYSEYQANDFYITYVATDSPLFPCSV